MTDSLPVQLLTKQEFSPFGDVIDVEGSRHFSINDGMGERFHDLARLDAGPSGRLIISIVRSNPAQLPFNVTSLERHPQGTQAFMPLSALPYLVLVSPRDGNPENTRPRCFLARGNQGVNYARGIWHHTLVALHGVSEFLVLDREGPGGNCDVVALNNPVILESAAVDAALAESKRLTGRPASFG